VVHVRILNWAQAASLRQRGIVNCGTRGTDESASQSSEGLELGM